MKTKNPAAAAQVRTDLEAAIARLEACTLDDQVFGWPQTHLAMRWHGPNDQGHVTNLEHASPWRPGLPTVTNGHGERAIAFGRQDAIRAQVAQLRSLITNLDTHA